MAFKWWPRARRARRCFPLRAMGEGGREAGASLSAANQQANFALRIHVRRVQGDALFEVLEGQDVVARELVQLSDEVMRWGAFVIQLQRVVQVAHGVHQRRLLVEVGEVARVAAPRVKLPLAWVEGDGVVEGL